MFRNEKWNNKIEKLKKNQQKDFPNNDILNEKDEEIKKLKESLNKIEVQKKDLEMKLSHSQKEINNFKDEKINKLQNEVKQLDDKINDIISKTTKIEEILDKSIINIFQENNQNIDINQNNDNHQNLNNLQHSTAIVTQSNGLLTEKNNKITIQDQNNK